MCFISDMNITCIPLLFCHFFQGSREEWQLVFYGASGITFLGAVIFLLFGSGRPLPWALPDSANKTTYIAASALDSDYSVVPNSDLKPDLVPKITDVENSQKHSRLTGRSVLEQADLSVEERKGLLGSSVVYTGIVVETEENTGCLESKQESSALLSFKEKRACIPESKCKIGIDISESEEKEILGIEDSKEMHNSGTQLSKHEESFRRSKFKKCLPVPGSEIQESLDIPDTEYEECSYIAGSKWEACVDIHSPDRDDSSDTPTSAEEQIPKLGKAVEERCVMEAKQELEEEYLGKIRTIEVC